MDGILIVDKPQGMTSHDVVNLIRRRFAIKKVGHAGTLDPIATGVLVMLLGKYTKFSDRLIKDDKSYEATMVLGATSDTGDAWGKIEPSGAKPYFTDDEIKRIFDEFIGEIEQTPPMYSAVKYKGRKLYEFARKGVTVQVAARKIFIKDIKISRIALPEIGFDVVCSKGTYIRQLCSDIGKRLECGAYLSALRRIRSGAFTIDGAIKIEDMRKCDKEALCKRLIRP